MARILKIVAIVILVLVSVLIGYRIIMKSMQSGNKGRPLVFAIGVTPLKLETVRQVYQFKGIVEGDPQVKVYPPIAGKFQYNAVKEGSFVGVDTGLVYITRDAVGESFQPSPVRSPPLVPTTA